MKAFFIKVIHVFQEIVKVHGTYLSTPPHHSKLRSQSAIHTQKHHTALTATQVMVLIAMFASARVGMLMTLALKKA